MSRPSITLKWGSPKSFFSAAFFTSPATPGATKRLKSDSRVSAATSASVGGTGLDCASDGAITASDAGSGATAVATVGGTEVGAGAAAGVSGGAATGSPSVTPWRACTLRRDQRDRKPLSCVLLTDDPPARGTTAGGCVSSARACNG